MFSGSSRWTRAILPWMAGTHDYHEHNSLSNSTPWSSSDDFGRLRIVEQISQIEDAYALK